MTTVDRLNIEITANGPMLDRSMRDAERRVDVGATRMAQSVRKAETAMAGGFMSNIGKRGRSVGSIGGIAAGALGGAVGGLPGFFLGMAVFSVVNKGLEALTSSIYKAQTAAERFAQRIGGAQFASSVARGDIGASLRGFIAGPRETDRQARMREIEEAYRKERQDIVNSNASQVDALIGKRAAIQDTLSGFTGIVNFLAGRRGAAQRDFANAGRDLQALAAAREAALGQLDSLRARALGSPMRGQAQASFDTISTLFGQMRIANRFKGQSEPATEEKQDKQLKTIQGILELLKKVLGTGFMPFA